MLLNYSNLRRSLEITWIVWEAVDRGPRERAATDRDLRTIEDLYNCVVCCKDNISGINNNIYFFYKVYETVQHFSAITKSAAACDWYPRQRRFGVGGVVRRLAAAASLPLLTCVALSRGQDLGGFLRQLGKRRCQPKKHQQQVHRQITSLRRRRRCQLAGLTPLAYVNSPNPDARIQTYVLYSGTTSYRKSGKAA